MVLNYIQHEFHSYSESNNGVINDLAVAVRIRFVSFSRTNEKQQLKNRFNTKDHKTLYRSRKIQHS